MAKKSIKQTKEERKTEKPEAVKKVSELRERIKKEKEELTGLLLEKIQFKLKNTSSIKTKKDQIARMLTALRQVELAEMEKNNK